MDLSLPASMVVYGIIVNCGYLVVNCAYLDV